MLHAERPYRRAVVVADFLLFGVEAHALADDGGFGAVGAPDGKGHFEAHGEDALVGFAGSVAEGMSEGGQSWGLARRSACIDLLARNLICG